MAASGSGDDVVVIKKYANRRLYDTESSSYITLERLAEMVRQKREFKVLDAKSGEDITHAVLTQIIMDEESRGKTMLPVNFLRQLIGMYGDQMHAVLPQYLEASLDAFQRNQNQMRDAFAGAFTGGPLAELTRRNMELFQSAASGGLAKAADAAVAAQNGGGGEAAPAGAAKDEELERLKSELAALQSKVEKLTR